MLRGLDEHTAHAEETATPTQGELDPDAGPLEKLWGSVRHYDDPTAPVAEDDWAALSEADDVRRMKGMLRSERSVSVEEMNAAIQGNAGKDDS